MRSDARYVYAVCSNRQRVSAPGFSSGGYVEYTFCVTHPFAQAKDAARVVSPFLRVFGACYEFLPKCNMPASKAKASPSNAPEAPGRSAEILAINPSSPRSKGLSSKQPESNADPRLSETHRPRRNRSPRGGRRIRGSRRAPRRSRSRQRPAASSSADTLVDRRVRDERLSAWLAGEDLKGALRDK